MQDIYLAYNCQKKRLSAFISKEMEKSAFPKQRRQPIQSPSTTTDDIIRGGLDGPQFAQQQHFSPH